MRGCVGENVWGTCEGGCVGGESVGDMGGMCGVGCVGGHVREDVWGRVCDKACVGEHVGVGMCEV